MRPRGKTKGDRYSWEKIAWIFADRDKRQYTMKNPSNGEKDKIGVGGKRSSQTRLGKR